MNLEELKILLVEDNDGDYVLVREYLKEVKEVGATKIGPYQLIRASKLSEASKMLKSQVFAAILLDLSLPDAKDLEGFLQLKEEAQKTPIILLTGLNDFELARHAVYQGAHDFLIKDETTGRLIWRAILYALEREKAYSESLQLKERISRAEKLESIGVLAGGLAHDLNNLLQGILNCSFLATRSDEKDHIKKQLDQIDTLVTHAEELIDKLFTCSGKTTFEYEKVNLTDFIDQNKESFKSCLPENHDITFELGKDIKNIEIDPSQLRQIIINLITNASEAIDEDGKITVRTGEIVADKEQLKESYLQDEFKPGHYSYFEVQDNGCGMDDATKERILEPFFTTKKTGRGLGLASVHGIIKSSKGTMIIESTQGEGSKFRVLLPAI